MPIFALNEEIIFPPVRLAEESGILAVGGDLSPERLIEAYRRGIFPWYSEGDPIIWWSPDPRFVLFPDDLYVSKTMRQVLRRNVFRVTCDNDFRGVIEGCREPRRREQGTWITEEMLEAYVRLHELGIAHSVEAWQGDELAGGLYGLSLGKCFFGESMFARADNASKAAFITLVRKLTELGFVIIDCQVYTAHLESLGAVHIDREEYLDVLKEGLQGETLQGSWKDMLP
ncbi:MAG TPA: leucyl/phenylalanyl-tRNA--protein transferase [Spirochaetota bacterium]|nr:leucyl/phenylalanyl-tRNA--protein transferase [Spirochaetota bacterium]HPC39884.1 leucyl/phenylalanyl-tRNA--protein transferase [Spirochaetota bacterium]HPL18044.1 leucyl/phenylalanyl-tRNA--protein transferase [Spirochaetota bacterium]HQF08940.1 leucyl/phenylalanyl-tRNA--protein transferase [Spirochaetota bacterium]HQH97866.1 leucyl/phenylalanyl-tRNA--protein transferase [Spirochaetota bacterium]